MGVALSVDQWPRLAHKEGNECIRLVRELGWCYVGHNARGGLQLTHPVSHASYVLPCNAHSYRDHRERLIALAPSPRIHARREHLERFAPDPVAALLATVGSIDRKPLRMAQARERLHRKVMRELDDLRTTPQQMAEDLRASFAQRFGRRRLEQLSA